MSRDYKSVTQRIRLFVKSKERLSPNYVFTTDQFRHYGKSKTVTKIFTRLCREGLLTRISYGYYVRPGPVDIDKVVNIVSFLKGKKAVPGYGKCFKSFDMPTRNLSVNEYLTDKRSEELTINGKVVRLTKSADWELIEPRGEIGRAFRVLIHPLSTSNEKRKMINHIMDQPEKMVNRVKGRFPSWTRPYFENYSM